MHWASGKRGTAFPRYSILSCAIAASQARFPGEIRTERNNPSRCAFRNALIERAISFGVLCMGVLAAHKYTQVVVQKPRERRFTLIVTANTGGAARNKSARNVWHPLRADCCLMNGKK